MFSRTPEIQIETVIDKNDSEQLDVNGVGDNDRPETADSSKKRLGFKVGLHCQPWDFTFQFVKHGCVKNANSQGKNCTEGRKKGLLFFIIQHFIAFIVVFLLCNHYRTTD